jgi:hypothetical protein
VLILQSDQVGELVVKHYSTLGTEPEFRVVEFSPETIKVPVNEDLAGYQPAHHSVVNSVQWSPVAGDPKTVVADSTVYLDGDLVSQQAILHRIE